MRGIESEQSYCCVEQQHVGLVEASLYASSIHGGGGA